MQESDYAQLGGVSVALLGLLAYVGILGTALVRASAAAVAGFALAAGGLAFSLYLVGVQAFVLDAWCVWCLASDAVMAALAVATAVRLWRG